MKLKKSPKLNIIVTAGPTREPIDPVRFISNRSTGFFGCEIAREAQRRGHRVILISGLTSVKKPQGMRSIDVTAASQMQEQIRKRFNWCNCLIMTAAVCDFRPKRVDKKKIKRGNKKELNLILKKNPDILKGLSRRKGRKILIGVSLETENLKINAQDKLREKNLDLIVATQMNPNGLRPPFGPRKIDSLIIDKQGCLRQVGQVTKRHLSRILLERIEKIAAD